MPVVSRLTLRQHLGQNKLRDTYIGTTTASCGPTSPAYVMDSQVANPDLAAESLYARTWVKVNNMTLNVGSFNAGSGAYVTAQTAATSIPIGVQYEHHRKLSPDSKDRAIDGVIGRLWSRQELPIDTAVGCLQYSIGTGFKIFGVSYFANPASSTDRGQAQLMIGWTLATTGSGRELRLPANGALGASQQIVLDAQVRATLGSLDTATVNIPDEDWVLDGAAARCFQALWADAPGKEAGKYQALAQAFGKVFIDNIGRFRDTVDFGHRGDFDQVVG